MSLWDSCKCRLYWWFHTSALSLPMNFLLHRTVTLAFGCLLACTSAQLRPSRNLERMPAYLLILLLSAAQHFLPPKATSRSAQFMRQFCREPCDEHEERKEVEADEVESQQQALRFSARVCLTPNVVAHIDIFLNSEAREMGEPKRMCLLKVHV